MSSPYRSLAEMPEGEPVACPVCRGMSGFVEDDPALGEVTFYRCTACGDRGVVRRTWARAYWLEHHPIS